MVAMREKEIEQSLRRAVLKRGGLCLKFISPGWSGAPDRLVLLPEGRLGFIEVKAPGKKPRPLQMAVIANLAHIDFETWVIDSPAEVKKFINHYVKIGYLT